MTIDDAGAGSLEVSVTQHEETIVLSVRGEVDLVTAPQLTESIDAVLAEHAPPALIIDLTDVPFLASVGMTVLLDASRRVTDATEFAVVADGPTTARPLTLLGLDQEMTLYTDVATAVAALSPTER
ncbi:STAS domain-containing protein [Rhodococcus sp. Eu-32]|uniref:STAS domain-containing protein n=1 Tax=Rhodococcus sp. Eu-32 TaxID=1017319 RepID=UPI000DF3B406|nr:STAS domain-containing protein [Rhodococcus sp. Eu-32]RRQ25290.1 STAS domain-containing protein [Rhodococcus sp. Eu-32]